MKNKTSPGMEKLRQGFKKRCKSKMGDGAKTVFTHINKKLINEV